MGCSGLGLVWWWLITVLGNGAVVFVAEWDMFLVGGSGGLGGAVMMAGSVGGVIVVFVGWGDCVVGNGGGWDAGNQPMWLGNPYENGWGREKKGEEGGYGNGGVKRLAGVVGGWR